MEPDKENDKLLSAKELADHLRISEDMVYRLCKNPEFPKIPIGRIYRFNYEAVIKFFKGTVPAESISTPPP